MNESETTDQVKMCPHGMENALYSNGQPCTSCVHEVLAKLTQCHGIGHESGEDPPSWYLTAVGADESVVDACLYRCIRCDVLF